MFGLGMQDGHGDYNGAGQPAGLARISRISGAIRSAGVSVRAVPAPTKAIPPTVPEQREQQRTQAIEQELRRRGADRTRPQYELDYIGRLLQQF